MNSDVLRAVASVPSTHFGLAWEHSVARAEVAALVRRCEIHDSIVPRNPVVALSAQFVASDRTAILAGRDAGGELRAVATVRWAPAETPGTVALRAHIDPEWRNRGIGRQVLTWQDSVAISALGGEESGLIGVTIPSGLVDRRRLYTAAGFSSRGRVEGYLAQLCDQNLAVPDVAEKIVTLRELGDLSAVRSARTAVDFVATGMHAAEGVGCADLDSSHVSLRDGEVVGSVLVHMTEGASGEPMAMIHDLRPGSVTRRALLATTYLSLIDRGVASAYVRLTPDSLGTWEDTVLELGATPWGAYVIYSIEWP